MRTDRDSLELKRNVVSSASTKHLVFRRVSTNAEAFNKNNNATSGANAEENSRVNQSVAAKVAEDAASASLV